MSPDPPRPTSLETPCSCELRHCLRRPRTQLMRGRRPCPLATPGLRAMGGLSQICSDPDPKLVGSQPTAKPSLAKGVLSKKLRFNMFSPRPPKNAANTQLRHGAQYANHLQSVGRGLQRGLIIVLALQCPVLFRVHWPPNLYHLKVMHWSLSSTHSTGNDFHPYHKVSFF